MRVNPWEFILNKSSLIQDSSFFDFSGYTIAELNIYLPKAPWTKCRKIKLFIIECLTGLKIDNKSRQTELIAEQGRNNLGADRTSVTLFTSNSYHYNLSLRLDCFLEFRGLPSADWVVLWGRLEPEDFVWSELPTATSSAGLSGLHLTLFHRLSGPLQGRWDLQEMDTSSSKVLPEKFSLISDALKVSDNGSIASKRDKIKY